MKRPTKPALNIKEIELNELDELEESFKVLSVNKKRIPNSADMTPEPEADDTANRKRKPANISNDEDVSPDWRKKSKYETQVPSDAPYTQAKKTNSSDSSKTSNKKRNNEDDNDERDRKKNGKRPTNF